MRYARITYHLEVYTADGKIKQWVDTIVREVGYRMDLDTWLVINAEAIRKAIKANLNGSAYTAVSEVDPTTDEDFSISLVEAELE